MKTIMIRLLVLLSLVFALVSRATDMSGPIIFTGMCDASAVVTVSDDLFVVGNDEDNILGFYRLSQPGKPVQTFDLNRFLYGTKKAKEADLEAAARLGGKIFWISSHGRNVEGKVAPNRARFFALEITNRNKDISVQPVGHAYTNLIADLAYEPKLRPFRLGDAAKLAPKSPGALNIEALAATPDGALLIGFRNPVPEGRALIVPLLNPDDLLIGKPPRFGDPILLDLGGLGLRDMCPSKTGYYLLAGHIDGKKGSRLYRWERGSSAPQPVREIKFPGINPEGICLHDSADGSELLVVSDDGTRTLNGHECKNLPQSERQFRAFRVLP